jgi:hypothetical protein
VASQEAKVPAAETPEQGSSLSRFSGDKDASVFCAYSHRIRAQGNWHSRRLDDAVG